MPVAAATKLPPDAARYREAIRARMSTLDTRGPAVAPFTASALADAVHAIYLSQYTSLTSEAAGKTR